MEFFNKKEDVIDLEITPMGEILLSQGSFTPAYYAFFDDEVLYDGEYGGVAEPQKETKGRIKDVLRMKTQANFRSAEDVRTAGARTLPAGTEPEQVFAAGPRVLEQDPITKNFALPLSLGNSKHDSTTLPAWDIKFLYGSLTDSVQVMASSVRPFLKIPQLDAEIIYKSYKTSTSLPKGVLSEAGKNKPKKHYSEFEELHEDLDQTIIETNNTDEIYYDFDEDFIILEILEDNVPYSKENFDIEVFEIEIDPTAAEETKEILIPKYFIKPPAQTKNDLLMSFEEKQLQTEKELQQEFPDLDDTYVEYYFEISADNEIDNELMCEVKPVNKKKGVFISDQYDCLDPKEDIPITSIYGAEENSTSLPDCE